MFSQNCVSDLPMRRGSRFEVIESKKKHARIFSKRPDMCDSVGMRDARADAVKNTMNSARISTKCLGMSESTSQIFAHADVPEENDNLARNGLGCPGRELPEIRPGFETTVCLFDQKVNTYNWLYFR